MIGDESTGAKGRPGRANSVVVVLLAGILGAILILIVVLTTQRTGPVEARSAAPTRERTTAVVAEAQTIRRAELVSPPPSPKPIDDPDRIKETLRPGKTYRVVLKAGLDSRVEDKAWGLKQVVSLAYAAEMGIDRTIEVNDGKRIVELRHFVHSRNVKLLCDVESVTIHLGIPGTLLLGALDYVLPGATETLIVVKPIAEAILGRSSRAAAQGAATKAVAHVDSLAGKAVRITYVDGVGVEAIEPVGCTLTQAELDFIAGTAVLSDCSIWDMKRAPGARWKVDGAQLSGLIDPSLRGSTDGEIGFIRDADDQENGRAFASLRIEEGTLRINSSDASTRRIGSFTPTGTLRFSLVDKVVEQAKLVGRFDIEEVSTDHLLFETSFKSRPTLTIDYSCTIR